MARCSDLRSCIERGYGSGSQELEKIERTNSREAEAPLARNDIHKRKYHNGKQAPAETHEFFPVSPRKDRRSRQARDKELQAHGEAAVDALCARS